MDNIQDVGRGTVAECTRRVELALVRWDGREQEAEEGEDGEVTSA